MKFIILGSGSSMGVPRPDGFFGKCDPKNPKNLRSRCSAFIKSRDINLLIDTSPDLEQMLKNRIVNIDCVFYTHNHADQTHGINDLRIFVKVKKFLCMLMYYKKISFKIISYCFKKSKDYTNLRIL